MSSMSQHELQYRMSQFMKKKISQFPELKDEKYYIEPASSLRPVEKHHGSRRSQLFPAGMRLAT